MEKNFIDYNASKNAKRSVFAIWDLFLRLFPLQVDNILLCGIFHDVNFWGKSHNVSPISPIMPIDSIITMFYSYNIKAIHLRFFRQQMGESREICYTFFL